MGNNLYEPIDKNTDARPVRRYVHRHSRSSQQMSENAKTRAG